MKTESLKQDQWYILIDRSNKIRKIKYSGTSRTVKGLNCWFFYTEENACIFLCESEVNTLREYHEK